MSNSVHHGTFIQVVEHFSSDFYLNLPVYFKLKKHRNIFLNQNFIKFFSRFYRIHGINWSHKQETHLTTASQDGTVKYFCINNPRRAEKIITTSSPVWRARYTVKTVQYFFFYEFFPSNLCFCCILAIC